jgi:hypothetical protein
MVLKAIKVDDTFLRLMEEYRKTEQGKGLLEQCSKNIVLFADKMLGIRLYAWQVDFLTRINKAIDGNYYTREFLAITSRQIGKSMSVAILVLWACVFNKAPGTLHTNTIAGVVSASDVQAKKLLYEIKKLVRSGDRYMAVTYLDEKNEPQFGEKFFSKLLDDAEPNNTTTVTFKPYNPKVHGEYLLKDSKSGSMVKSYPPTPIVLGETFTIVIEDEAGMTDRIDDQFHYDYIYPTGNSTNAIRIYTSTPWTPSGFFYRLADPNDEYPDHPADRVMFDIEALELEAPEQYKTIMEKTIGQMNKDGKIDEVQRAYYCRFVKGEKSYFNAQNVFKIFTKDYQMLESYLGNCDMGIDFGGQVTSKTVVTIARQDDAGHIQRLYCRSYEVGGDLSLLDDIADLLTRFNIQRIIPDDCPAGDFLIRTMIDKGWNVYPMNFRTDKVKKYGAFRAALNREEMTSYEDSNLKTEMIALEQTEGNKQSYIMHAPGYTDDLIDSFVMSCYFFVQEDDGFNYYDTDDFEGEDTTGPYGFADITDGRYYEPKV